MKRLFLYSSLCSALILHNNAVMNMNRLIILLLQLTFTLTSHSQSLQKKLALTGFDKYVKDILEDSTNRWKEYPRPPSLTNDIEEGLSKELQDDSVKYYFEQLSFSNIKLNWSYTKSLSFFERHQLMYAILAAAAHWNPDTRVSALTSLSNTIKLNQSTGFTKKEKVQAKIDNKNAVKFLIYLLKNNPVFITGSENATIHSIYISNITRNLDLLTNQNIITGRRVQNAVLYYTDTLKVAN